MAGLLDKKKRFIDFVVTQEGKRQIASGKMRAEYVSLTDKHTFYHKGEHDDVSNRLFFQVMEHPNNMIVMEKDDSGKLIDFDFSPSGSILGNDVFDKDATLTSANNFLTMRAVTGSQFASTSTAILKSFLTHFKSNKIIGTYSSNGANKFELNKDELLFAISNTVPFKNGPNSEIIELDNAEPFFLDSKLSHFKNFTYLPPVNTDGSQLADFPDLGSRKKETLQQIKDHLGPNSFDKSNLVPEDNYKLRIDKRGDFNVVNREHLEDLEVVLPKQFETINFKSTSTHNNLVIQFYEDGPGSKLIKLDMVDAGSFIDEDDNFTEKRIFYVGKVYSDSFNVPTFINIFTIVFD